MLGLIIFCAVILVTPRDGNIRIALHGEVYIVGHNYFFCQPD